MSSTPVAFGKRGTASSAPAIRPVTPEPSTAYGETVAAARAAFSAGDIGGESFEPTSRANPQTEEEDLRAYFGSSWQRFAPLWVGKRGGLCASWSFMPALAGVWLLYRKQYALGAVIVAASLALDHWSASLYADAIGLAAAALLGLFGKSIVLAGARKTVAAIRKAHGDSGEGDRQIIRAGRPNFIAPALAIAIVGYLTLLDGMDALGGGLHQFHALRAVAGAVTPKR